MLYFLYSGTVRIQNSGEDLSEISYYCESLVYVAPALYSKNVIVLALLVLLLVKIKNPSNILGSLARGSREQIKLLDW